MPRTIHVAHSPDSDDAFMFYALAEGKIDTGDLRYVHELSDIETLNQRARRAELEVTAVSIHAYAYLWRDYALLGSGSSMGDGYGPRLVAPGPRPSDPRAALRGLRVAVPGCSPPPTSRSSSTSRTWSTVVVPFDQIEDAVHRGEVDVGLLIHEGQLTYGDSGPPPLGRPRRVVDGGHRPAPAARRQRRAPGPRRAAVIGQIARDLRASIVYALEHRAPALAHAKQLQPRDRRRAHRHLRRHVREPMDRGLRPAGPPGGADAAGPRARGRSHSRASRGGVRGLTGD